MESDKHVSKMIATKPNARGESSHSYADEQFRQLDITTAMLRQLDITTAMFYLWNPFAAHSSNTRLELFT